MSSMIVFCDQSLSRVQLFVVPWPIAHQAPPWGFSRQEYWNGLPCSPLGDLSTWASNPGLLYCRWILYQLSYQGSPPMIITNKNLLKEDNHTGRFKSIKFLFISIFS